MENKTQTYIVAGIVLMVLTLVGIPTVSFSMKSSLEEARAKREQVMQENADVQRDLAVLQEAAKALEGVSEVKQSEYLSAIPAELQQEILIKNLNDVAAKHGVNLSSVQFGLNESQDVPRRVSINASFQSGYSDLIDFLKALEANSRRIHVKTISVQVVPQTETTGVNFTLDMEAFYQGA